MEILLYSDINIAKEIRTCFLNYLIITIWSFTISLTLKWLFIDTS